MYARVAQDHTDGLEHAAVQAIRDVLFLCTAGSELREQRTGSNVSVQSGKSAGSQRSTSAGGFVGGLLRMLSGANCTGQYVNVLQQTSSERLHQTSNRALS